MVVVVHEAAIRILLHFVHTRERDTRQGCAATLRLSKERAQAAGGPNRRDQQAGQATSLDAGLANNSKTPEERTAAQLCCECGPAVNALQPIPSM